MKPVCLLLAAILVLGLSAGTAGVTRAQIQTDTLTAPAIPNRTSLEDGWLNRMTLDREPQGFKNNVKPVDKGTARLQVRHTAAAPTVDVWANGAVLVSDFEHGQTATEVVPKGVYAAWVSLPGDYQQVIGPAVLSLSKGYAYQVYAWGNETDGYDFAVVAVRVGTK